jgi:hypothetical protein
MVNLIGGIWSSSDTEVMYTALSILTHPDAEMPYCIIQTVESGLAFVTTETAGDKLENEQLLRLHLFGEGGDFTLRYDDGDYLWRFVGTALSKEELGGDAYPGELVVGTEQHALLWGEFDSNRQRWYENIVGSAQLTYPIAEKHERLTIHARSVIDRDGEVVAFWTYKLAGYIPQQENKE